MMKGQSDRHVPGAEPLPQVAAGVLAGRRVGGKRIGRRHTVDCVRQAAPVNDPVPGLFVPRDRDLRHSSLDILAAGELTHHFAWLLGDVIVILKKSPAKSVRARHEAGPRCGCRNDNREPRKIHGPRSKKSPRQLNVTLSSPQRWQCRRTQS